LRTRGRRDSDFARATPVTYRKTIQIALVAVARELVGFLWAARQDCPTSAERRLA